MNAIITDGNSSLVINDPNVEIDYINQELKISTVFNNNILNITNYNSFNISIMNDDVPVFSTEEYRLTYLNLQGQSVTITFHHI